MRHPGIPNVERLVMDSATSPSMAIVASVPLGGHGAPGCCDDGDSIESQTAIYLPIPMLQPRRNFWQ